MAFPGREQGRSRRDRNFGSSNIYKLATLVVMLGVTFSRGLFSTSIDSYVHPKEAKAKWATTNKKRELGYIISMFGSIDYLCGAIMLAWTLRDRDPNHDLVAVISGKLDSPENYTFAVEVLEEAGYKVYNTPLLEGPTKERPWFKYYYSKLNVVRTRNCFLWVSCMLHGEHPCSWRCNLGSERSLELMTTKSWSLWMWIISCSMVNQKS